MQLSQDFFLKKRFVVMRLARDLLAAKLDDRLHTVDYYVEQLSVSRGTVQEAMRFLIEQGCISTHFKGHLGTFLLTKNQDKLWKYSGFGTLSGSMSLPLNKLVAGFATGICDCMRLDNIAFNCVFVQGSRTRLKGLALGKYDFIVASKLTEKAMLEEYREKGEYGEIEKLMEVPGCSYGGRYVLLFSNPTKTKIEEGMTVAVDPSSIDQFYLTQAVCEGNSDIHMNKLTYIDTRYSVKRGESDVTIARTDVLESLDMGKEHIKDLSLPWISKKELLSFSDTVILARKNNDGLNNILRNTLRPNIIANTQKKVMAEIRTPSYF